MSGLTYHAAHQRVRLTVTPAMLDTLDMRYGVSRERVRKMRARGHERMRAALHRRDLGLESRR